MVSKQPEALKLFYDVYKHLTTISTGAIVLLASLIEKIFQQPEWKPLVAVSFLSFMVCVVASVAAMFGVSAELGRDDAAVPYRVGVAFRLGSGVGFLVGVAALVVFSIKNFM